MIVVVSIHHAGTHFVLDHLLREYERLHDNTAGNALLIGDRVVHVHAEPENLNQLHWWLSRYECIVPLRHPGAIVESWASRDGKKMADLVRQYETLVELDDLYRPNFLPIDASLRNYYLRELNQSLDTNFTTDWPRVMSNGKVAWLDAEQLAVVDELMSWPINQRFYSRNYHVFRENAKATLSPSRSSAAA